MIQNENWDSTIERFEMLAHPGDFRRVFDGTNCRVTINDITPPAEPLTTKPKLHIHDYAQINWVMAGTGIRYERDESIEVKAGDIFSLAPGIAHGFTPTGTEKIVMVEIFSPIPESREAK